MNHNKKKINSWIIGTGTGILAILGIRLIDFLFSTKILGTIWSIIISIFRTIGNFFALKFEVSLWFLILLPIIIIGLIIFVLWIISKYQEESTSQTQPQIPFLNYTQDIFEGILYRWEYGKHYSGKYQITNISHYCPNCKCSIVYGSCPVCKSYYSGRIKDDAQIDALIRYRIENKNNQGY